MSKRFFAGNIAVAIFLLHGMAARADDEPSGKVPESEARAPVEEAAPPQASVPGPSWLGLLKRPVILVFTDGQALAGQLVGFDDRSVTLLAAVTGQPITVARSQIVALLPQRAYAVDPLPLPLAPPPRRDRHFGIHGGALLFVFEADVQYHRFYAFVSSSPLYSLFSQGTFGGFALGGRHNL